MSGTIRIGDHTGKEEQPTEHVQVLQISPANSLDDPAGECHFELGGLNWYI